MNLLSNPDIISRDHRRYGIKKKEKRKKKGTNREEKFSVAIIHF